MNNKEKKHKHIYASFVMVGRDLDPAYVTESLGVSPHKSFRRGSPKTEKEIWKHGYWELSSNEMIDSPDLMFHIEWIVNHLIPQSQKIREMTKGDGIKAKISCLWIMPNSHEALMLNPKLLEKISALGVSLELDLYCDN